MGPVFLNLHSYRITFLLQLDVFTEALDDVLHFHYVLLVTNTLSNTVKFISINQMEIDKVEYAIHTYHKRTHAYTLPP